jgi:hypothetical protein
MKKPQPVFTADGGPIIPNTSEKAAPGPDLILIDLF